MKVARGRSWQPEIGMEHASRGRRSGNKGVGAGRKSARPRNNSQGYPTTPPTMSLPCSRFATAQPQRRWDAPPSGAFIAMCRRFRANSRGGTRPPPPVHPPRTAPRRKTDSTPGDSSRHCTLKHAETDPGTAARPQNPKCKMCCWSPLPNTPARSPPMARPPPPSAIPGKRPAAQCRQNPPSPPRRTGRRSCQTARSPSGMRRSFQRPARPPRPARGFSPRNSPQSEPSQTPPRPRPPSPRIPNPTRRSPRHSPPKRSHPTASPEAPEK